MNRTDSLAHHGIEGQKWGVRNGPPYPLDRSMMSGRERRLAAKAKKKVSKAAGGISGSELDDYIASPEGSRLFSMKYSELLAKDMKSRERGRKIVTGALSTIGGLSLAVYALKRGLS